MNWRDLLYFSKGERRALTLLAAFITAAWLFLLINEPSASSPDAGKPSERRPPVAYPAAKPARRSGPLSSDRPASTSSDFSELSAAGGEEPREPAYPSRQTESSGAAYSSRPANISRPAQSDRRAKPSAYPRIEKFPPGTVVELNTADTLTLKKVPGIGSAFARRIVKYRRLLGGFCSVGQLGEVYGIDEERYDRLSPWFRVDTVYLRPIRVNRLLTDTLPRHPYLSYRQLRAIRQQLRQKGKLSGWENLSLLEEFTEYDRERLRPYLTFE